MRDYGGKRSNEKEKKEHQKSLWGETDRLFRLCKRGILPELLISILDISIKTNTFYNKRRQKSTTILRTNETILAEKEILRRK